MSRHPATAYVDPPASEITGSLGWRIVGLLMLFSLLNYFNRISMPVAGERIMRDYTIGEVQMGWIYSSLLIAYAVFMIPGGWFSDRDGGGTALSVMGFGTAICCALTGLAGHPALAVALIWPSLLLVRAVMGAFTAPLYPAAGRVVTNWIPFRRRAMANGLVTGSAMVGIALAYPLFAALIERFGWQWSFVITGVVTGLLTAVWSFYGSDSPDSRPHAHADRGDGTSSSAPGTLGSAGGSSRTPFPAATATARRVRPSASWRTLMRNRSLWLITASYFTMGYVEYLIFYWSEHYFKQVLQFGEREGRFAAMLPPLAMALGIPLGGWIADRLVGVVGYRWGRASVGLSGMVACGLLLYTATLVSDARAIVTCFTLSLGAAGLAEAAAWATAIDLGGLRGASSAAIANTGGNVGGFTSPVVTPWVGLLLTPTLGRQLAWAWGLRLGALVCLAGACLWFWIDAAERARDELGTIEESSSGS